MGPREIDAVAVTDNGGGGAGGGKVGGIPIHPVVSRIDAERRLHRVLAHGLCHLIGYTHNSDHDRIEMQRVEDYMLGEAEVVMRTFPPKRNTK